MSRTICNISHVSLLAVYYNKPQGSFTRVSGTQPSNITASRFAPRLSPSPSLVYRHILVYIYYLYIVYEWREKGKEQLSPATHRFRGKEILRIFFFHFYNSCESFPNKFDYIVLDILSKQPKKNWPQIEIDGIMWYFWKWRNWCIQYRWININNAKI